MKHFAKIGNVLEHEPDFLQKKKILHVVLSVKPVYVVKKMTINLFLQEMVGANW